MIKLIHQPAIADNNTVSPFDMAIQGIVRGQEVIIACPYITIGYLEGVLKSAQAWRLLTDVDEWLSQEVGAARENAMRFLQLNKVTIHHCPKLHAKVVSSRTQSLIGSANLTNQGLTHREEVGVLIDQPDTVSQLWDWFEYLWQATEAPDEAELHGLLHLLALSESFTQSVNIPKISSPYIGKHTRLVRRPSSSSVTSEERERLLRFFRRMPNSAYANTFFELLSVVLNRPGVDPDDKTFACVLRKDLSRITVQIGTRYVLAAWLAKGPSEAHFGLNVAGGIEVPEPFKQHVVSYNPTEFKLVGDETPDAREGYLSVKINDIKEIVAPVMSSWLKGIEHEINRGLACPQRAKHQPVVIAATLDIPFRTELLKLAFERSNR